jgi:aminomethyltransferase
LKRTILHERHLALGAKMAPFGGYEMPIQYSGIIREHAAVRRAAAVFDTCHMGEFRIRGPASVDDLEKALSCEVASITVGQCRYGFITNEAGGVDDDQILYRMGEKDFFMVVNASTEENDFRRLRNAFSSGTSIENLSARTGKLDLQGPASAKALKALLEFPIDDMKYYRWAKNRYRGSEVLVSRTGYTGELGFEIYATNDLTKALWDDCLAHGVVPAGLGARDTLRLEMGFPLYGHELDERSNPAESGFTRAIAGGKRFTGSDIIRDPGNNKRRLVGISLDGRRAARHGDTVLDAAGRPIGKVTSGSFSPSLSCAIALGYVVREASAPGAEAAVQTERGVLSGRITDLPFYKMATGRAALRAFL